SRGEVLRDEIREAIGWRIAIEKIVERQGRAGFAPLLDPDLRRMDNVGPLAHRRLSQKLVRGIAPADELQIDLDVGIELLERVDRPAYLRFSVVEAEGDGDGLRAGGACGAQHGGTQNQRGT